MQAPGHLSTIPQGIAPKGSIVGCIHDTNTSTTMFGMSLDSGGFNFFGGKFGGSAARFRLIPKPWQHSLFRFAGTPPLP
ncbi:MAG TPA: hypothetical protein VKF81_14760 [Blastocatellia bacterium]|nr:hypothetical protein [Blastocatellia bacterium]